MKLTLEKKVLCGLGLATVVIAAVAVVGHITTSRMMENAAGVSRCHALIESVTDLALHTQVVRMSTRGYVITGDDAVLRLYDEERGHLAAHLDELRGAMLADPQRRERLAEIERLTLARLTDG